MTSTSQYSHRCAFLACMALAFTSCRVARLQCSMHIFTYSGRAPLEHGSMACRRTCGIEESGNGMQPFQEPPKTGMLCLLLPPTGSPEADALLGKRAGINGQDPVPAAARRERQSPGQPVLAVGVQHIQRIAYDHSAISISGNPGRNQRPVQSHVPSRSLL